MRYEKLFKLLQERKFLVVDTKTGAVVEDGFIYDTTSWAIATINEPEAIDTSIDKFLAQLPSRYMLVRRHIDSTMYTVIGALVSFRKDFAAGYAAGKDRTYITTVTGKEIHLQ